MNIVEVQSLPEATRALAEGADVTVDRWDIQEGWCRVRVRPDDDALASKITQELGWKEVNRTDDYICLYAPRKQAHEAISDLRSLAESMIDVHISTELAGIVAVEEVQFLARWFSGLDSSTCTEAFLVPVSRDPQDAGSKATSCAVIIVKHGTDREQHYGLCYIYNDGNSPTASRLGHSNAAHICALYDLQPDIESHQALIAEALEKQA